MLILPLPTPLDPPSPIGQEESHWLLPVVCLECFAEAQRELPQAMILSACSKHQKHQEEQHG